MIQAWRLGILDSADALLEASFLAMGRDREFSTLSYEYPRAQHHPLAPNSRAIKAKEVVLKEAVAAECKNVGFPYATVLINILSLFH